MHEIRKIAEEQSLDLICMQEPYTRDGKVPGMPVTARVVCFGERPMAVTIIFNKQITATIIQQFSNTHNVCLELSSLAGKWILLNTYCQFGDEIEQYIDNMREVLTTYETIPVVIMADANAKSPLWYNPPNRRDERGEMLMDMILENQLEIINRPNNPPTFHNRAGAKSNIDVTLSNGTAFGRVNNWKVWDNLTTSDHNLITFDITKTFHQEEQVARYDRRYNIRKANWDRLRAEFRPPTFESDDINHRASEITKSISEAMTLSIPLLKNHKPVSNRPWTEELTRLRTRARKARKRYQQSAIEGERQNLLLAYRNIKDQYKQKIYEVKTKSWEEFVERCLVVDPWGMPYKIVSQKIRSPALFSSLEKSDGTMTKGWRESAETLLATLLPDDDPLSDTIEQQATRAQMVQNLEIDTAVQQLEVDELKGIINALKKKKAPGPDGICGEVVQALQDQLAPTLCSLYNDCLTQGKVPNIWKQANVVIIKKGEDKDPTKPRSYRPICLLNVLGKIQEKFLCKRLQEHRQQNGLNQNQYGFRQGRSTEDAVNRALFLTNNSNSKYVIATLVDISGAFDNLWWPALFLRLRQSQCPKDLQKSFRSYCQDRYANMKCLNESISKVLTRGCPQGSVCGPIFWDIVIEELLEELEEEEVVTGTVAYADDLLVLIEGNSRREIERKSTVMMELLKRWCDKVKLCVSPEKTTYIVLKGSLTMNRNPTIKYDGKIVRRSTDTRYLGIQLDERQCFRAHIEIACAKGTAAMQKIASMAQRQYKIPLQCARLYLHAVLQTMVGYGASVWAARLNLSTYGAKVNKAQRGVLLRLTGAFRTTATEALTVVTGVMPLDLAIKQQAAMYWLKRDKPERVEGILGRGAISKTEIKNHIMQQWQTRWDNSTKGRRTHQWLPNVGERFRQPEFNPSQGLIHFLTGHGPYPSYLHRMNLKEDDRCDCGEVGTPEHALFDCPNTEGRTEEERGQLRGKTVAEILNNQELVPVLDSLALKISKIENDKYKTQQQRRQQQQQQQ